LEAARLSHKGRVVLLLDEWDKTRPSADAFLLDFLQEGRIRWGVKEKARLENLVVFLTSNGERELSEPLLRRLPVIGMKPHSPTEIARMLEETHPGHPFMGPAVRLYEAGLLAWERGWSPRPVTIQELRQLLDAVTLDPSADWGALIDVFIAKTPREREGLRAALAELRGRPYVPPKKDEEEDYPLEALEEPPERGREEAEVKASLPRIPRPWRPELPPLQKGKKALNLEGTLGVVVGKGGEDVFSFFAKRVIEKAKTPRDLRPPEEVVLGVWQGRPTALLKAPLPPEALKERSLWEGEGEVLVRAEGLEWKKALQLFGAIRHLSPKEVVGRIRAGDVDFEARALMGKGGIATIEVVVPQGDTYALGYAREKLADLLQGAKRALPPDKQKEDPRYWGYKGPVPLGGGLEAFYRLTRTLDAPAHGDRRGVVVTLLLPAEPSWGSGKPVLASNIRFGERVRVMGSSLSEYWGSSVEEEALRQSRKKWVARKVTLWEEGNEGWKALFARAKEYVLGEIAKLREAITRREAILWEEYGEVEA